MKRIDTDLFFVGRLDGVHRGVAWNAEDLVPVVILSDNWGLHEQ